jgi:hypothetical protein
MARFGLAVVLLVILLPSVFAIGFYLPTQREFLYSPGQTLTYQLGLKGTAGVPIAVTVEAGELEPHLYVNADRVVLEPQEVRTIRVQLNMPQSLSAPGLYPIKITATENPNFGGGGGFGVTARAAVEHTATIINPHPNKYPRSTLVTRNGLFDTPLNYGVDVVNYGLQVINSAKAKVEISYRGTVVASADTNQEAIPFLATKSLRAPIVVPQGTPGRYEVKVTVEADGQTETFEGSVFIGRPEIQVESYTPSFDIGRVNEMSLMLMNIWDQDVQGSINLELDVDGKKITARNPEVILYPWTQSTHSLFFSVADDIEPGTYTGTLTLDFLDTPQQATVQVELKLPEPDAQTQSPTTVVSPVKASSTWLITTIILLLVIILLTSLMWYWRMKKRE